ncbi:MAG TPA: HEAT repeat domain-containing protein [Minicystis sp.]|nr:HEAT repeat domain-containing protein [Minicystis sp.]
MAKAQDSERKLKELFDAERSVRRIHDELARLPADELLDAIGPALKEAEGLPDDDEAALRLVRIAALLGEHEGPRVVDGLIDVLGSEHPEARRAAGEELEELAFDRFKEVALGVERALKRLPVGSPALPELPYILSEIPEPGVSKLLVQFLKHKDADAVAAAIESLVELGDTSAKKHLEALAHDDRAVELADDESDETSEVTIGELAAEAIDLLSGEDDDDEDDGGPAPTARRGGAP